MKDQPLKVRLAYFWEYYKWPSILAVLIVIALIYTVTVQLNRKEDVLSGILINSTTPLEDPEFLQAFCNETGIDTNKQSISLLTSLSLMSENPSMSFMTYERIHAGIASKETDFLIAEEAALQQCGYDSSHMLLDLREFLSPEQLTALEDRLYYIDGTLLERDLNAEEAIAFPSPFAPEEMENPVPVGIDICDCTEFLDSYYSTKQPLYFAVVCNAPHLDSTLQFFEYIMEHTNKE